MVKRTYCADDLGENPILGHFDENGRWIEDMEFVVRPPFSRMEVFKMVSKIATEYQKEWNDICLNQL